MHTEIGDHEEDVVQKRLIRCVSWLLTVLALFAARLTARLRLDSNFL